MANNPPPSSFHLDETRMLTRSRRLNTHPGQSSAPSTSSAPVLGPGGGPAGSNFPTSDTQYAPGVSHRFFEDSEPDSPFSNSTSPVMHGYASSASSSHFGGSASGRHSRGGRDSDASASGASSFGPERTSRSVGSTSPIASTSRSGGGSNINPVTGKRKRSRVSPAQLTTLERIFLKDRSPTAAKRKELAEQLGMNERQTQVWFQNRRAKAKLLEQRARAGRPPARTDNSGSSSGASFGPNAGLGEVDADALRRIHEDGNVFIIPSTDLCIGTFRRVSAGLNDLIGYTSDSKRVLAWYIYSAGTGFKMEVSLDNIVSVEMTEDAMQAHSRATIHLSGPPSFYREFVSPGDPYGDMGLATRQWQRSDDWTENRQGTLCLVHTVVARTAAIEYAFAAWLPQRDFSPEDGAGSDADAESSARGAAAHSPSLRRSRHGSEASALTSPMATIQTPSLLGVLPSPAPPSSYRDPFANMRGAQPRGMAGHGHAYSSAPHLPHDALSRGRSRSDASSPYGYYAAEADFGPDQSGRHSTGAAGPSHLSHPHAHHSHLHPLVNPSTFPAERVAPGPYSAGPFTTTHHDASDTFNVHPEPQPLSAPGTGTTFYDFDSIMPPFGATGASSNPGANAGAGDDAFLADAPIAISRSYSSSNIGGRAPGGGPQGYGFNPASAAGAAPSPIQRSGTAASHHSSSLSQSPYSANTMPPPPPPASSHHHSRSYSLPQSAAASGGAGSYDVSGMLPYDTSSMGMGGLGDNMHLLFPPSEPSSGYPPQQHQQPSPSSADQQQQPSEEARAAARQFLMTPQDESVPSVLDAAGANVGTGAGADSANGDPTSTA